MTWNPSPQVAVAREAAKKLGAEVGCIIVFVNRETLGMASYGHTRVQCGEMGKLGDRLYDEAMDYLTGGG